MEYKILALDLDGTLTNSEKQITEKTKDAVDKARNAGVNIVLASGRPVLGIKPIAEKLDLYSKGGFILANNGSHIIDCKENVEIYKNLIPVKYYKRICEMADKYQVEPLTYTSKGLVAQSDTDKYVRKEAFNNSTTIKVVPDLLQEVDEEVTKFMIVGEPEKLKKILPAFQDAFKGELGVFLSEPYFMELVQPGIEKARALEIIMNYVRCTREQIIAVGDGLNDIPMLRFAGVGVAMANSSEEVLKEASFVTLSNDQDGVAVVVEKYIL